jgi:hypothetical protein
MFVVSVEAVVETGHHAVMSAVLQSDLRWLLDACF